MTMFETYLVFNANNFQFTAGLISFLMIVTSLGMAIGINMENEFKHHDDGKDIYRNPKRLIAASIVAMIIAALLPSTKTLIAMYAIPAVTQSEKVRDVGSKAAQAVEKLLDEYLKEEK